MNKVKLSKKHQIVVPKSVRQKMKLRAGDRVSMHPLDESHAILVKYPDDPVEAMRGLGKEIWRKLGGAERYIKRERSSWDKKSV